MMRYNPVSAEGSALATGVGIALILVVLLICAGAVALIIVASKRKTFYPKQGPSRREEGAGPETIRTVPEEYEKPAQTSRVANEKTAQTGRKEG